MDDYIPKGDAHKVAWVRNFRAWLDAHGADHGLSAAEVAEFDAMSSGAESAYAGHVTAHDAAKARTAAKNTAFREAVAVARQFAQRIQHDPHTTDQDRGAAAPRSTGPSS